MARPSRRPRTDRITSMWMIAALVSAAVSIAGRGTIPETWWTTIHLVTLGVLTNGILQWSWYFARGLLHLPPTDRRAGRDALVRSLAFNVALIGLVAGIWTGLLGLVLACAVAIGVAVAWHGLAMARAAKGALGSRYAPLLRFYVVAAALFVLGCAIAGLLTVALLQPDAWGWLASVRDELSIAHAIVMVAGWLGLSIAGTLVTLGPTMLRTRMDDVAAPWALRALPWLAAAVVVSAACAVAGWWALCGAALAVYGLGLVAAIVAPLVRSGAVKAPRDHATWSVACGLLWAGFGLVAVSVGIMRAPDAASARDAAITWVALIGAGGLAQIFVGALSYLLPVVVGGGPAAVRVGIATIEWFSPARLAARNLSLVSLAVTTGTSSPLRWVWWAIIVATYAIDIGALGASGARQARARRAALAETS